VHSRSIRFLWKPSSVSDLTFLHLSELKINSGAAALVGALLPSNHHLIFAPNEFPPQAAKLYKRAFRSAGNFDVLTLRAHEINFVSVFREAIRRFSIALPMKPVEMSTYRPHCMTSRVPVYMYKSSAFLWNSVASHFD